MTKAQRSAYLCRQADKILRNNIKHAFVCFPDVDEPPKLQALIDAVPQNKDYCHRKHYEKWEALAQEAVSLRGYTDWKWWTVEMWPEAGPTRGVQATNPNGVREAATYG